MSHPFEGTPQYGQQYGTSSGHHGHRIGRNGNGLGSLWGSTGSVDDSDDPDRLGRRPRMTSSIPLLAEAIDDGEDVTVNEELSAWLSEALNLLTSRQAFVIGLRFGLRDGIVYRLVEIAELMGSTTQAVSDIEQRALSALQKLLTGGTIGG